MKTKNFVAVLVSIALSLALLIYWREYSSRDQVALYHVILWQVVIWLPWIFGFKLIEAVMARMEKVKFGNALLIAVALGWTFLHYGWFFFISNSISPYLELPGSRYGVYRYFFIFWTLIDLALTWFIFDKLRKGKAEVETPPLRLELTRGNTTYLCEPSQIQLLAAENYYTRLFTTQGVFLMRKPLKYFHHILPQHSFRKIHRSTVINVNYVSELSRGNDHSLEVIMKDGTRRRVSRSYVKEIMLFFKDRTY